jgi:hypothetical protein
MGEPAFGRLITALARTLAPGLITFPTVVGRGDRLFASGVPADFRFTVAEPADSAALTLLTILRRDRPQDAR